MPSDAPIAKLRSRAWFDNPANVDMTSLYLERLGPFFIGRVLWQSGLRS